MKKVKEYYICDRCKKELDKKELKEVWDRCNGYTYELCKECENDYEEYYIQINELDQKYREITKEHNFGRYMYQEDKDGQPTR